LQRARVCFGGADGPSAAVRFELKPIAFQVEHGEAAARRVPATMAGPAFL